MQQNLDFTREIDFSVILTNPILDIAARLWEENRYEAFRTCYRSMRRLDDLVDDRKALGPVEGAEARLFAKMMRDWLFSVEQGEANDSYQSEFLHTLREFAIPIWPWQRLVNAMEYDLHHDGFESFSTFLRYCEGAAVAPASVFVHLCGISQQAQGFRGPTIDTRKCARPLAIFSYLVHIIRDFEKDHRRGLNYFASSIMKSKGVSIEQLREIAHGGALTEEFMQLVGVYTRAADYYRTRARATLNEYSGQFTLRYRVSLELIYELYCQIFERFQPLSSTLSEDNLQPSPAEIEERIGKTLHRFGLA